MQLRHLAVVGMAGAIALAPAIVADQSPLPIPPVRAIDLPGLPRDAGDAEAAVLGARVPSPEITARVQEALRFPLVTPQADVVVTRRRTTGPVASELLRVRTGDGGRLTPTPAPASPPPALPADVPVAVAVPELPVPAGPPVPSDKAPEPQVRAASRGGGGALGPQPTQVNNGVRGRGRGRPAHAATPTRPQPKAHHTGVHPGRGNGGRDAGRDESARAKAGAPAKQDGRGRDHGR